MAGEASGGSRIIQEIFANSRGGCSNLLFNSALLLSATYFHKRHIFSHSVHRADTPPARHLPGQTPLLGRHPTRQTPSGQTPLGRHPPGQTPSWADTLLGRHLRAEGYCCGRYGSYWNTLLFAIIFVENYMKTKMKKI